MTAEPRAPAPGTPEPVPTALDASIPHTPALERPSPSAASSGRDRYLDLLRAIALVRIVAFHTFFQAVWLSVVFPSMGVMFALAGSLMARSLQRPATAVLKSRTRRLLLPLWAYSLTVVAVLLVQGWRPEQGDAGGWWLRILLWFVPIGDPPFPESIGSDAGLTETSWGMESADILWYIRAYFWFVLLSPLLLKAFRKLPWVTLMAPLGLVTVLGLEIVVIPGAADSPATDFATYGACWLLGFAYHDGLLRRVPFHIVLVAALAFMSLGLFWVWSHLEEFGWDLGANPLGQALWSFGVCALLLRISPSWSVLPRSLRFLDKLIALINNRAITVYLWHNLVLIASVPLIDLLWNFPVLEENLPWLLESELLQFIVVWPLLGLVFLAIGWIEDVAAKRRPRLWPTAAQGKGSSGKATKTP
ncbi:acyltransferase family protein [Arthrobacter sp. VKM Ac-2550]|uniref:acyltransferase family protein n=1 Tax=Crystallibacter permensis TaxID=1938888 RepID=UPI002227400D|nr:acyltransferase [Arthrobacter sp. VKM Ac-2550]MCW2132417.1 Peptidoglycan/LPS O-acetylase OafA/YrhL, contains acyltransferase and SGNH-hydrolase domains [Arthrobacter sp. VKM Ac-2550]